MAGFGSAGYGQALGFVGEMAGDYLAGDDRALADEQRKQRLRDLEQLARYMPDADKAAYEQEILQGRSEMDGVAADPEAVQSQRDVLRRLQQVSTEGYNAEDRAAIDNTLADVGQQERGNRLAIQSRLAPNSGASIAAQLANQQAAASRANQQGLGIAAGSRAQALRALQGVGTLSGQMRGQSFSEGAQKANANDAIARFNTLNRVGVQQRNVGSRNDINQQNYANRLGRARAMGGARQGLANASEEEAKRKVAYGRRVGEGLGGIVGSFGGG